MKYSLIIIISLSTLFCQARNKAKKHFKPFYITYTNDTVYFKSEVSPNLISIQKEAKFMDSLGNIHIFKPSDIKSFTIKYLGRIYRYDIVKVDGDSLFLINSIDGSILKRYVKVIGRSSRGAYSSIKLLCKNGYAIKDYANTDWNISVSRALSEYPILSQIIYEKKCDLTSKKELKVIIKEYNDWIEKRKNEQVNLTDTSMTIKGLLDAKKHFNAKRNFYLNFFANGLFTPFVGLPVDLISGFTQAVILNLPDKKLKENADYMRGYKAKAFTLKNNAAVKGNLWGYALLIPLIVVDVILNPGH
jgi:hypothetical protein